MLKKFFWGICFVLCIAACNKKQRPENQILVGTIAGPETSLMEIASQVAKEKYGLDVRVVQFNDYVLPNTALADGSIDANMFQHEPYLEAAKEAKGFKIMAIGKTFVYPMGIYSKKIKNLRDLKPGSTVAIPNDPSNEARALLLLHEAGVITLKNDHDVTASVRDIKSNPLKLKFDEMDAAQLPRALDDVTIAAINTNYAMVAGLLPSRDAIFMEQSNSPYANVLVIRDADKTKTKYYNLLKALQSNAVLAKAKELFKDQAIPAWR